MVASAVVGLMGAVYLDGGEGVFEDVMNVLGFGKHQFL